MGICQKGGNKINQPKKVINECMIQTSPLVNIDSKVGYISKSICKIKIEFQGTTIRGTGFLLKFNINQEPFYCLMTNHHLIKEEIINNQNIIEIKYDNEYKSINIILNREKRYIRSFTQDNLDITVVEILEEDNISRDYFLYNELETMNNKVLNMQIYIPQYPKGEGLKNSKGQIIEINEYTFTHLATTMPGSSGSPIFLENSIDVIGIHRGSDKYKTENYGCFIYPVIEIIKNDINKKRNNGKNILYEGEFINGKFEGNGKYIYDDGKYYIGQYKNGLREGKGIIYYKNGKLLFECKFINDTAEGNGKYIWENGEYYIGQYKNGLKNGKGTMYYSNGNIKYDGDWINDKYEGNGKYIREDGKYYIGQWKNDLRNGKGTMYYPNGKMVNII